MIIPNILLNETKNMISFLRNKSEAVTVTSTTFDTPDTSATSDTFDTLATFLRSIQ